MDSWYVDLGNFDIYLSIRYGSVAENCGDCHFPCQITKQYFGDLRRQHIYAKTAQTNINILAREIPYVDWPHVSRLLLSHPRLPSLSPNLTRLGMGRVFRQPLGVCRADCRVSCRFIARSAPVTWLSPPGAWL